MFHYVSLVPIWVPHDVGLARGGFFNVTLHGLTDGLVVDPLPKQQYTYIRYIYIYIIERERDRYIYIYIIKSD